jgi:cytoskeletal protein CcmA (bactofilin family)
MIFQRTSLKLDLGEEVVTRIEGKLGQRTTDMETVVGPSVQVEGDFASEGNIIVRGVVRGTIYTTKHLLVDIGAKVIAHIQVGTAVILGEVKGNIKATEKVELMGNARVIGDIETEKLVVADGVFWTGKVTMPGMERVAEEIVIENTSKTTSGKNKKN